MGKKGQRKQPKVRPDTNQVEVVSSEPNREQLRNKVTPDSENVLTSIPLRIHCPPTQDEGGADELDNIAIDDFLDTLAEVALSIASRKLGRDPDGGEVV